jgi:hypothetical protein
MGSRDLDAETLNELLAADHDKIRALLDQFLNHVHAGNWQRADSTFSSLERLTDRHLEFEEQQVFPVFDQHPELCPGGQGSTEKMLAQHQQIRARLGDVGIGLQLHQIREVAMQRLAQSIDEHAADEDVWAQSILHCIRQAGEAKLGLMQRLRELVSNLRSSGT